MNADHLSTLFCAGYPTPGPMDYDLQGVSMGPSAPKHSLHPRLYPLNGI